MIDRLTLMVANHCDPPEVTVTEEDYDHAVRQEQAVAEYQAVHRQLMGLSVREYLNLRPIVDRYRMIRSNPVPPPLREITEPVIREFTPSPSPSWTGPTREKLQSLLGSDEVGTLETALRFDERELARARQQLPCPHCQEPVVIMNGTLCKSEHLDTAELTTRISQLTTRLSQVRELTTQLTHYDQYLRAKEKWESSEEIARINHQTEQDRRIRQYHEDLAHNERYEAAHRERHELTSLLAKYRWLPTHDYDRIAGLAERYREEIPTPPLRSSATIRSLLQRSQAYRQYQDEGIRYQLPLDKKELISQLTRRKEERDRYYHNCHLLDRYRDALATYQAQYDRLTEKLVPVDDHEVPGWEEEIATITHHLQLNDRIKLYHQYYADAQDLITRAEVQAGEVAAYQGLYREAQIAQYEFIEEKVGLINQTLRHVCNLLFKDGLSADLTMFTMTKNKEERPKIGLHITHRMLSFDDYRSLSGGECDRLSLAITLALNACASSPFLFLDECGQSLDRVNQDLFIRALRERTPCTIVVVMHEGPEELFDHIIEM